MRRIGPIVLGVALAIPPATGEEAPPAPPPPGFDVAVAGPVRAGCDWLLRHQGTDGSWDCDGFTSRCGGAAGACDGPGSEGYDVGVTALAMEALLRALPFDREGRHPEALERAADFLLREQGTGGFYGPEPTQSRYHTIYNHALGTLAMARYAAGRGEARHHRSVARAVAWLIAAQNDGAAWRYMNYHGTGMTEHRDGSGINDTSITAWAVVALHAADRVPGVDVPPACLGGANAFLDTVMTEEGGKVKFGYYAPNAFVHRQPYVTTGCGMTIRQVVGNETGVEGAARTLLGHLPDWTQANAYEWHWSTTALAMHGGVDWDRWRERLHDVLLTNQEQGGCAGGSWDPNGTWGSNGGRVYSTALAVTCLLTTERNPLGFDEVEIPELEPLPPEVEARLLDILDRLGASDWKTREQATGELREAVRERGRAVIGFLEHYRNDPDPEVRARIRQALGY